MAGQRIRIRLKAYDYRVLDTSKLRTLDQLTQFVAGFNGHRPQVRAFFSMVDRRKKLHLQITKDLQAERPGLAATPIPALSMIERMSVERAPVSAFAPGSVAARSEPKRPIRAAAAPPGGFRVPRVFRAVQCPAGQAPTGGTEFFTEPPFRVGGPRQDRIQF